MFTVEQMIELIVKRGYTYTFTAMPRGVRGYVQGENIYIDEKLEGMGGVEFVLAHEFAHAERGDTGHQSPYVEALCDERAAALLLTEEEYREAESTCDSEAAIAAYLGTSIRVVRAFQRHLTKKLQAGSGSKSSAVTV